MEKPPKCHKQIASNSAKDLYFGFYIIAVLVQSFLIELDFGSKTKENEMLLLKTKFDCIHADTLAKLTAVKVICK